MAPGFLPIGDTGWLADDDAAFSDAELAGLRRCHFLKWAFLAWDRHTGSFKLDAARRFIIVDVKGACSAEYNNRHAIAKHIRLSRQVSCI